MAAVDRSIRIIQEWTAHWPAGMHSNHSYDSQPKIRASSGNVVPREYVHLRETLTPWSRVLLEKLAGRQLVKKFPSFCRTRRFITALTRARHLSLSKKISPGPRLCIVVRNMVIFYGEKLLAPHPTPKLEGHPLSAVRDCLFNVFEATLHIRRPFLHPQPEDAPCRGDRDRLSWRETQKVILRMRNNCTMRFFTTCILHHMLVAWTNQGLNERDM
jgi:hypothetical protein